MAQGLTNVPPARQSKPYITNGVNSEFVESWLPIPEFQPTVSQAFEAEPAAPSPVATRGGDDRGAPPDGSPKVWVCG